MTITISHRGIVVATCKTHLEAWEKMQKWNPILKPLDVRVSK